MHDDSETTADSFVYELVGPGGSASARVDIVVSPVDDAPTIVELAQTHVISPQGKTWEGFPGLRLKTVAERDALVMVRFIGSAKDVKLVVFDGNQELGSLPLDSPDALPTTESNGRLYATDRYSATVPAVWVRRGMSLQVRSGDGQESDVVPVVVGAPAAMDMTVLPFYLFGAGDMTVPFEEVENPSQEIAAAVTSVWPLANLELRNQGAGSIVADSIVVAPRDGNPAYVLSDPDAQNGGFDVISAALPTLSVIRNANGDQPTNNQYYAPIVMASADGSLRGVGGGLGGGHTGAGDHSYTGIFIHEQGHAFGLPHASGSFDAGDYPYPGGSLDGSSWAYDAANKQFIDVRVPSSSSRFENCASDSSGGSPRRLDDEGFCIRQDPMQSGSADRASDTRFSAFSDFSAAKIQAYFEGETTRVEDGTHDYSGGRIFVAADGSYKRWNSIKRTFVPWSFETTSNGLYGLDGGAPMVRAQSVHTIVVNFSLAGTAGVTRIEPPMTHLGNLRRLIDPTDAPALASIVPNTSANPWYCHASGCDYTLAIEYSDGQIDHVVLQGAFRQWWLSSSLAEGATDPSSGTSFKRWAVTVPDRTPAAVISSVRLLDTPTVYNGMPASPAVLAKYSTD